MKINNGTPLRGAGVEICLHSPSKAYRLIRVNQLEVNEKCNQDKQMVSTIAGRGPSSIPGGLKTSFVAKAFLEYKLDFCFK